MTGEITDADVAAQIERADRFIADFREMVAATVVDPRSPCAEAHRRGLERIAETLDAVPYVTFCNLANLDAALRGGLLDLIEVGLLAVGGGPTLDYADAAAFLAGFEIVIEKARRRRLQ
jgi:glycerol dehydrogenase-like iron-containing ADH family enzyme